MSSNPSGVRKFWESFKAYYLRQFASLFLMLAAVALGLLLRENVNWLKENVDFPLMALLSGIIGIIAPNIVQFGNAGKVLTGSENKRINLLVGAGAIIVVLILANALVSRIL